MLTFNATLPLGTNATGLLKAYSGAGGAQGLLMRVSQAPCKASGSGSASLEGPCCSRGFCGNWAGAALRSRGCIQFGVLEVEAALNFAPLAPSLPYSVANTAVALFTAGTALQPGGLPDATLSEVDQSVTWALVPDPSPQGPLMWHLTYSAALAQSGPAAPTKTMWTPTAIADPVSSPAFPAAGSMADYHNYKLVWTPSNLTWMVDLTVYRTVSTLPSPLVAASATAVVPWKPTPFQLLLLTRQGSANGSVVALSDSFAYVRRVRYTAGSGRALVAAALAQPNLWGTYPPPPPSPPAPPSPPPGPPPPFPPAITLKNHYLAF